jgi:hypothetical protein
MKFSTLFHVKDRSYDVSTKGHRNVCRNILLLGLNIRSSAAGLWAPDGKGSEGGAYDQLMAI